MSDIKPITPEERTRRIGIIHRAIDWLEENPSRHMVGALRSPERNGYADPRLADENTCFCAAGRIIHEAKPRNQDLYLLMTKDTEVRPEPGKFDPNLFYLWLENWLEPLVADNKLSGEYALNTIYRTNDRVLRRERRAHAEDRETRWKPVTPSNALTIRDLRAVVQELTGVAA